MFRLKSISRSLKGGETMKKTLGLVLALVLVVGGAAVADSVTFDTYAKLNMISAPLVPLNPDATSVFSNFDLVFTTNLSRWDSPSQSMVSYDPWASTPGGDFGNVLLGDGYWLIDPNQNTYTVTGIPDGVPDGSGQMTDMWISLPGNQYDGKDAGGWNMIGQPFNHDTPISTDPNNPTGDNIFVTDGTTLLTLGEADAAGWLDGMFSYWDGSTQTMMTAGFFFNDDDSLRPGKGYYIKTKKDNLALIIPAE